MFHVEIVSRTILLLPIHLPLVDIFYMFWSLSIWYCWWLKSCTIWYGEYPIIYRVLCIPGGAGFLPSTVVYGKAWKILGSGCSSLMTSTTPPCSDLAPVKTGVIFYYVPKYTPYSPRWFTTWRCFFRKTKGVCCHTWCEFSVVASEPPFNWKAFCNAGCFPVVQLRSNSASKIILNLTKSWPTWSQVLVLPKMLHTSKNVCQLTKYSEEYVSDKWW